jgi:TatD DNase family protein
MNPRLIDTHAHVNFNGFKDDADEVIERAFEKGIQMFSVGSQIDTSKRAVHYAEKYDGIWAIVGLHPIHLVEHHVDQQEVNFKSRREAFNYDEYKKLASHKKVIGIGECGLDYFHIDDVLGENKDLIKHQKEIFRKQIALSVELNKPLAIHCRGAYDDVIEMMHTFIKDTGKTPRALMHCYLGDKKQADAFIRLGFYISFSGIITFKNAGDLTEVVKHVPLEKIVVETDCPYLSPEPMRGRRNEPAYVEYTARKVAEIKGVTPEEVFSHTTNNAKTLFSIK